MTVSEARCHLCRAALNERWASATDTEYGSTRERFDYYLCPACDSLSIDPLPADRLAQIYPPTYYSFAGGTIEQGGSVQRVKRWLDGRSYRRALEVIGTDAPRILDVGGGSGAISAALVAASDGRASATVVDIDAASIEAARAQGLEGFLGRIEEFPGGEFDLILMLNLIEHVAEPITVLTRARELLAPGGIVWLQTPNFRALDARLFRHWNWAGYHCPRHFVLFSEPGLRRALARAGLEPVRFQRTQGGSFWAQSLLGLPRARRTRQHGPDPDARSGRMVEELPRPLIRHPAFAPLAAATAAFDVASRRFRQVSQVAVLARPAAQ